MKLVMTLLVKNEESIVEDNIRFHAAQGVDAFLVMDNASTDGTPDILKRLASEFDLTIVNNPSTDYQQAKWMTSLAKQARSDLKADFVISNDADEFWACDNGQPIKSVLRPSDAVVTFKRYNYVQSLEAMQSGTPYWQTDAKVVCPILYTKEDQLKRTGLSMPLVKISPKVIVKPRGLMKIKGGNHRARHLHFWAQRDEPGLQVHHFPIRGYDHFEANIQNRERLLEANAQTRMGDHYRRWVNLYKDGKLEEEFARISLTSADLQVLEKVGVIAREQSPLAAYFGGEK